MKNTSFKSLFLFVKPSQEAQHLVPTIKKWAKNHEITLYEIEEDLPNAPTPLGLVLGGDGTMLAALAKLYGKNIPLAGINFGHLGFLTEKEDVSEIESYLHKLFYEETEKDERPYYIATLENEQGDLLESWPFINDVTLLRHPDRKMLDVRLNVQGSPVTHTRADGVIIATPTGSTAYNLSAGGPIVHPKSQSLVITPICPHTLTFRPVVVPPEDICFSLESPEEALLSLDGRENYRMKSHFRLKISTSSQTFTLSHAMPYHFFDVLRHKMGWKG